MLIRSTPNACLVILRSGLTLELSYDQESSVGRYRDEDDDDLPRRGPTPSQGVWIFHEEVLFEVKVGQA